MGHRAPALERLGRAAAELRGGQRVGPPADRQMVALHLRAQHPGLPMRREDVDPVAAIHQLIRTFHEAPLDTAGQRRVGIGEGDLHGRPPSLGAAR